MRLFHPFVHRVRIQHRASGIWSIYQSIVNDKTSLHIRRVQGRIELSDKVALELLCEWLDWDGCKDRVLTLAWITSDFIVGYRNIDMSDRECVVVASRRLDRSAGTVNQNVGSSRFRRFSTRFVGETKVTSTWSWNCFNELRRRKSVPTHLKSFRPRLSHQRHLPTRYYNMTD